MQHINVLEAILLGIVQGIAEFLPISSSGHLVIFGEFLSRIWGVNTSEADNLRMNVALHLGTLVSILVVYRGDLRRLFQKPRLCLAIVVATLPVVVVGLFIHKSMAGLFKEPLLAGVCLYGTAALLLVAQKWGQDLQSCEEMPLRTAFIIGLFQAVAILPGISRSGSTIAGGLLLGLRRDAAAQFSFFMAIPAICGAAMLTGGELLNTIEPSKIEPLAVILGTLTAGVVGWASLRCLIRIVTSRRLHWFAYYCVAMATFTVGWQLWERFVAK